MFTCLCLDDEDKSFYMAHCDDGTVHAFMCVDECVMRSPFPVCMARTGPKMNSAVRDGDPWCSECNKAAQAWIASKKSPTTSAS